tara:strand:+ start:560 stop:748 length:189 start_codon:yes stop_codon:yes gene_type:complete
MGPAQLSAAAAAQPPQRAWVASGSGKSGAGEGGGGQSGGEGVGEGSGGDVGVEAGCCHLAAE